jgi:hypothetical protein
MAEPLYTFFLAHSGPETENAKELRNLLHPDVSVFLDAYDLVPGDEWDRELPRRQRQSRATVALLSPATESAYYLREEIATALAYHRHEPDGHRLIPVYLGGIPKDPFQIPYGVRVLHALDGAVLGMSGVAVELKRTAVLLTGAPPPLKPPDEPPPDDQVTLYEALCRLLPPMFGEVVLRTSAPVHHLAPATEPLSRRALDLVQWAALGGTPRMNLLRAAIRKVAPGLLP